MQTNNTILYHASFNVYEKSILTNGIQLPNGKSNFDMYEGEYIFLAPDPYYAESFVESVDTEIVSDEIYDSGFCVFEVTLPKDEYNIQLDINNLNGDTFMVDKSIPPQYIKLLEKINDEFITKNI